MSALPPKADMFSVEIDVCFVPIADLRSRGEFATSSLVCPRLASSTKGTPHGSAMSDWLLNLPLVWMAVVVFAATYLLTASIYWVVTTLAVNDRARAFKALSPGMLSPLGILFALLVGFIAVEVWSNFDKAKAAVATEASALRAVVVLAGTFPEEQKTRIYALIDRHIEKAVNEGWPAMAQHRATLSNLPTALTEALHDTLTIEPADASQRIAQSEMVKAIRTALDARRQRIVVSESTVGRVKWAGTGP
jgi:hypothetical protein